MGVESVYFFVRSCNVVQSQTHGNRPGLADLILQTEPAPGESLVISIEVAPVRLDMQLSSYASHSSFERAVLTSYFDASIL